MEKQFLTTLTSGFYYSFVNLHTFYPSNILLLFQILIAETQQKQGIFSSYILIYLNANLICGLLHKLDMQRVKLPCRLPGLDKFNRHPVAFADSQIFLSVFILKL